MAWKNEKDKDSECFIRGSKAEKTFVKMARARGCKVRKSTKHEDSALHFDFEISKGEVVKKIEVKAIKKISRKDSACQDEWAWVEFKNIVGGNGWIYGKADYVAFEREKDFVMIDRKEMVKVCEEAVDFSKRVKKSSEAHYGIYNRSDRPDEEVSLVEISKILEASHFIWNKNAN